MGGPTAIEAEPIFESTSVSSTVHQTTSPALIVDNEGQWANVDNFNLETSNRPSCLGADVMPSHFTNTNHAHSNYSFASSSTYAVDDDDALFSCTAASSFPTASTNVATEGGLTRESDDQSVQRSPAARKCVHPRTLENLVHSASGFHESSPDDSSPCRTSSPLSSDASSPVLLGTPSVVFAPNSASPVRKHSSNVFADSDAGITI